MKKPNFFIIGAPKCGTTSLASWLKRHPNIFIPKIKELQYFNFDFGFRKLHSLHAYERFFTQATAEHIAVGEGTTQYLFSHSAVPAITYYVPSPLFIVLVRDPVDMAESLHEQTLVNGDELESDFGRAWRLQPRRKYGDGVPSSCSDPQLLQYGERCRVGEQLERLYTHVSREQVLVLKLDDLKADPGSQYRRVLRFLGVEDDGRQDFPVVNVAKRRKLPWAWRAIRRINRALKGSGLPAVRTGLTAMVDRSTREDRPRAPMSPALRAELTEYFSQDVRKLERLTGFDLAHWRESRGRSSESASRE